MREAWRALLWLAAAAAPRAHALNLVGGIVQATEGATGFHRACRSVSPQALLGSSSSKDELRVGDQVVAANDWNSSSPMYGIVRAQSYTLQRVYYQGMGDDGKVQRIDVKTLEAAPPPGCTGFTKYVSLFSRRYHAQAGPVVVKPTEVQLLSIREEVTDSAWLALPGLFWVWLAFTIYQYGETNGFVR